MNIAELLPYLPATNAILNSTSACFLGAGYSLIKRRRINAHRNCMITAFIASVLFLISYVTYHWGLHHYLNKGPTIFREPAWFRPIYLTILITHTFLAVVIVPLVLTSLTLGLRGRFEKHKRISRWTWPLWMYVSVTGVIIYLLLYQIFPQA